MNVRQAVHVHFGVQWMAHIRPLAPLPFLYFNLFIGQQRNGYKISEIEHESFCDIFESIFVLFVGATGMCLFGGWTNDGEGASQWNYNVVSIYLCSLHVLWLEQVYSNFELFELFSGIWSTTQHQPESEVSSSPPFRIIFDERYISVH